VTLAASPQSRDDRPPSIALLVRVQLALFLTVAFGCGTLLGSLVALRPGRAAGSPIPFLGTLLFGALALVGAGFIAGRVWPSLTGRKAIRLAALGATGPATGALCLFSSSTLRQDEILAFPVLVVACLGAIVMASYAVWPRQAKRAKL
jgi:hypothetical protein